MATLAFHAVEDDLVVYVGRDAAPDNAEWASYVRHAEDVARRWRTKNCFYKFFVFVDDSAPNAAQRAAVWKAIQNTHARAAVVTSSLIARKIVTAFGWLGAPMRGFAPRDLRAAADYLELSQDRLPLVVSSARALVASVGGCRTIADIPEKLPNAS